MSLESNRANAQLSTGPRTDEGKAKSSQNARKHGLTAKQLAIQPDDQEEFDELLAFYRAEVNPQGPIQQTLFEELITAAWNLRRVRVLQAGLDMLDPQHDRLARHHTRIERTFHRALKELKALQTSRALRATLPTYLVTRTPVLAAALVIAKRSQQRDREIREEFSAASRRAPITAAS